MIFFLFSLSLLDSWWCFQVSSFSSLILSFLLPLCLESSVITSLNRLPIRSTVVWWGLRRSWLFIKGNKSVWNGEVKCVSCVFFQTHAPADLYLMTKNPEDSPNTPDVLEMEFTNGLCLQQVSVVLSVRCLKIIMIIFWGFQNVMPKVKYTLWKLSADNINIIQCKFNLYFLCMGAWISKLQISMIKKLFKLWNLHWKMSWLYPGLVSEMCNSSILMGCNIVLYCHVPAHTHCKTHFRYFSESAHVPSCYLTLMDIAAGLQLSRWPGCSLSPFLTTQTYP